MLIKNQQKLNEYDYKSMMKNFESESRHKKFLNGIKNKWRAASCRYKEKVALIKIKNEKLNKNIYKKKKQSKLNQSKKNLKNWKQKEKWPK